MVMELFRLMFVCRFTSSAAVGSVIFGAGSNQISVAVGSVAKRYGSFGVNRAHVAGNR